MNDYKSWYFEKQALRTVDALIANGMKAIYTDTAEQAKRIALDMVPEGASVGFGGSLTLSEIGLVDELKKMNYQLINPTGDIPIDEKTRLRREAITADYYFTGTNAVTEDGKLVNIDGTGNRVASMIFGPKHVIVVTGVNKISRTLEDAFNRAKEEAAVMNARKLKRKTPCVLTGKCSDCHSEERICNITTIIEKKPRETDVTVIIIGEELGF